MNWLRKLLNPCSHKWEEVERYSVHRSLDSKQVGTIHILRCVHCGDFKRRTLR